MKTTFVFITILINPWYKKLRANFTSDRFVYLDDEATANKLVQFNSGYSYAVTFSLPQMHRSSCALFYWKTRTALTSAS